MDSTAGSYSPVPYVYREVIEEEIARKTLGKIFYFDEGTVASAEGRIVNMEEIVDRGIFLTLVPTQNPVRIDRIITLFGKPGAAYEEYDAYANACLSCTGGYGE